MFIAYENMWLSELPLRHQSCVLLSFPFLVLHEYCSGHEVEKLYHSLG